MYYGTVLQAKTGHRQYPRQRHGIWWCPCLENEPPTSNGIFLYSKNLDPWGASPLPPTLYVSKFLYHPSLMYKIKCVPPEVHTHLVLPSHGYQLQLLTNYLPHIAPDFGIHMHFLTETKVCDMVQSDHDKILTNWRNIC